MNKQEAKKTFLEADALYAQGRHEEALRLLQQLNRVYPRQKHIMYSAALCLEQLGRAHECIGLCEQLIHTFQDERAELILSRYAGVDNAEAPILTATGARVLNNEDRRLIAMLMQDPANITPLPAQRGSARALLYGLGMGSLVVAFLVFVSAFLYMTPGYGPTSEQVPVREVNIGQVLVLFFATAFAANMVTMYVLLFLMQRLRYVHPLDNVFDVAQQALYISLLVFVPVLGWIAIPMLLRRHYLFNLGELLLFLLLQTVLSIGFSLIFGGILFALGHGWILRELLVVYGASLVS